MWSFSFGVDVIMLVDVIVGPSSLRGAVSRNEKGFLKKEKGFNRNLCRKQCDLDLNTLLSNLKHTSFRNTLTSFDFSIRNQQASAGSALCRLCL